MLGAPWHTARQHMSSLGMQMHMNMQPVSSMLLRCAPSERDIDQHQISEVRTRSQERGRLHVTCRCPCGL